MAEIQTIEEPIENKENKLYEYNDKLVKPKLIKCDMDVDMRVHAYELAFESLNKYTAEKEMAAFIKGKFDKAYEPEWQCVVVKDFSVAFSHEIENFIFFQIEDYYFVFYKL